MKYLKNLLRSTREIFIVFIIQYAILITSAIIFDFDNEVIAIYGTVFLMLFELLYIIYIIRKKNYYNKVGNGYFPYILLGISLNVIYNMLVFKFGKVNNNIVNASLLLIIVSSGIIGPIFEEMLFRYSFINKLRNFNSPCGCIIISTVMFTILHSNINSIIYTLILGIINSYFYIKKKDIIIPIIIHISGNIIASFLYEFNLYILVLGIILLIISTLNIHLRHFNKR